MIQTVLALKGGWALVLANKAKEKQAARKNDPTKLFSVPKSQISVISGPNNADGTKRTLLQVHLDARKMLRIDKLCRFLLLKNEQIAGYLVLTMIQCIQETVAWVDRYT